MTATGNQATLPQALRHLEELGVVPRVAPALDHTLRQTAESLQRAIKQEIPAFSESGNPQILPDLEQHVGQHLREIIRLLGGGPLGDFDFVRAHAQRRAEQRFPLEATLQAYRCGHRVLSRWIGEAALAVIPDRADAVATAVADFVIEYANAISIICAAAYVTRTRVLAEVAGDRRTELLALLINGYDESDGRVARLLKRAGYLEQRQSFCVAVTQSADPLEMEHPAREQRIVAAVGAAVAGTSVRALVGVRNNVVIAVFSDTRRLSGWTAPQDKLAGRVQSALLTLGPAVLIGISTDQPSTAYIPRALHEATVALDFASVGRRVVPYAGLPIRRLLLHRAADYVQSALPAWIADLVSADTRMRGALVQTLRALADADINVQKAARTLKVHPNTVYGRLQRIQDLTGLDAQRYHDLTELLLAADCRQSTP